jgi:hypothetical protein
VVEVEQPPLVALGLAEGRHGLLQRTAGRQHGSGVVAQPHEIALERARGLGPGGADRAMPRHHPGRPPRPQRRQHVQPAEQAAVEHRHALHEQQVGEPERPGRGVERDEIVVGVRGRLGLEHQPAAAEAELEPVLDQQRRRHRPRALGERPEVLAQSVEVVGAARRERRRQLGVADERRVVLDERRVAEQVVGVDVARDHVADRPAGDLPDRLAQPCPGAQAAAAVDDRDRVGADDEADVGDRALVLGARELMHALMDEDAGRDLRHRQRPPGRGAPRRQTDAGERAAGCRNQRRAPGQSDGHALNPGRSPPPGRSPGPASRPGGRRR